MAGQGHIPRLYLPRPLRLGAQIDLTDDKRHHVVNVLRRTVGDGLLLFNDTNEEFTARLIVADRKHATLEIIEVGQPRRESPLDLTLVQAIARGDRMDFALAKAVELGVNRIEPVFTARGQVKLNGDRLAKKQAHWQRVVASAAEQSGRLTCPTVADAVALTERLATLLDFELGLILAPEAEQSLGTLSGPTRIALLIGPESGLSDDELARATRAGWLGVRLGPRVLRTETAGMAALAAIQTRWGDMG